MRFAAIALVTCSLAFAQRPVPISITIDASKPVRTMRGGMGASWHAIEKPILGRTVSGGPVGGSAWGANPPAEDERAWRSLYRHADWLGLEWARVELEQRMYEPRRREFDWDNAEMRILYRILDWAERNKVEVFLQQMWSNVEWNALPELRGHPDHILKSMPASLDDFAYGMGELVEHLVKRKGYTCIRWLCINNEPGHGFSWWQNAKLQAEPITPGLAAVRRELDRRGLKLPLSGPDWTDLPPLNPAQIDFDAYIGAYDVHSYNANFNGLFFGYPLNEAERRLQAWAEWAHARSKPLFLSELGTQFYGFRGEDPGPSLYESGIKDAALVVRGIGAGVDAFNKWSFTNRGDLDGQWQLVDTWDIDEGKLRETFTPHPNNYWLYGLLTRFTAANSQVFPVKLDRKYEESDRQLVVAALKSPAGVYTVLAVNEAYRDADASFSIPGLPEGARLHRYSVTRAQRDRTDVRIAPEASFPATFRDLIPAMSVVVYSTATLAPEQNGLR